MSRFILVDYMYRDADNYKSFLAIAVPGIMNEEDMNQISSRLTEDDGFIPGQIGLPDLQMNFNNGVTFWDDERDHLFHELLRIELIDSVPQGTMLLNSLTADELVENIMSIEKWDDEYRPDFHGAMAELKKEWDQDPEEFMHKALAAIEGASPSPDF